MKSRRVCIKTRSPPPSLSPKGQVTTHTTVKWPIFGAPLRVASPRDFAHARVVRSPTIALLWTIFSVPAPNIFVKINTDSPKNLSGQILWSQRCRYEGTFDWSTGTKLSTSTDFSNRERILKIIIHNEVLGITNDIFQPGEVKSQ